MLENIGIYAIRCSYYSNGVVFTNNRIVVPSTLQSNMLDLIHESHLGIEKCKARARELLYWPRMLQQIESLISNCNVVIKLGVHSEVYVLEVFFSM